MDVNNLEKSYKFDYDWDKTMNISNTIILYEQAIILTGKTN